MVFSWLCVCDALDNNFVFPSGLLSSVMMKKRQRELLEAKRINGNCSMHCDELCSMQTNFKPFKKPAVKDESSFEGLALNTNPLFIGKSVYFLESTKLNVNQNNCPILEVKFRLC